MPSGRWLRQAILYWDEIGSIVPQRYDETALIPYTTDIEFLRAEGEFRPFKTDLIYQREWKDVQEFESELVEAILSTEFQSMLPPEDIRTAQARVHKDKVSDAVFDFLEDAQLAKRSREDSDWYYFEKHTSLLYMALLAKYLADADTISSTVTGTNMQAYKGLSFGAKSNSTSFHGLSVRFFDILPVPSPNNSLADILDFKRRRQPHLLHFRKILRDVQLSISNCTSQSQMNDALAGFSIGLERGLSDLHAVLSDAKIATLAGSFEALIKSSSPGWIPTAIVATGKAKSIVDVPIKWAVGGTILAGGVGVAKYLIDRRNARRAEQRNSPFSYLCGAMQENII